MDAMKRKMSIALAQKQQMKSSNTTSPADTAKPDDGGEPLLPLSQTESSSDESINTGTMSTGSSRTIRASFDLTPGTVRTPSYPFPRMNLRLDRGLSQRSGPSHRPFTLLSPTNEPLNNDPTTVAPLSRTQTASDASTPVGQTPMSQIFPDDPNFPTPDLYDLILMLNAEPGLDMWWVNVTEILSEAYGADRASLAIPGDITDLENVPWGQKATYNIYGSDSNPSQFDSLSASELEYRSISGQSEASRGIGEMATTQSRRPPLLSRHSIAGPVPDAQIRGARQRPAGPVRAYSTSPKEQDDTSSTAPPMMPRLTKQSPTPRSLSTTDSEPFPFDVTYNSSGSASSTLRCHVHRTIQPLEVEADALLVRTTVASLFGKRKPVVMTRAYSEQAPRSQQYRSAPPTPLAGPSEESKVPRREDPLASRSFQPIDEYEQPEPSPWSQSPSPSPAARPDPSESPFFVQPTASIDETAFEQNPPVYDYATSANQSLNAIGAEMSKTLVHIPLIQPLLSRGAMTSNLRFPIAILSFSSTLNPYPRSLRHSLEALLPHLASSYSLAQQYSVIHDRIRGNPNTRHGGAFGLGGTFSDEGSELELVAELSDKLPRIRIKQGSSVIKAISVQVR